MKRYLVLMMVMAAGALAGCSEPKAVSCTRDAECPANATCLSGVCQLKPVSASGGSAAVVSGAARLTAGTMTMDATLGQPVTPSAAAGSVKVTPAENTR